jgi:hypothetical protein
MSGYFFSTYMSVSNKKQLNVPFSKGEQAEVLITWIAD